MNRFFIVGSVGALSGAKTIAGVSITIPRIPENKLMQIEEMSIGELVGHVGHVRFVEAPHR
jgi:hypothetical protein